MGHVFDRYRSRGCRDNIHEQKIYTSCEFEDSVETHVRKLCAIVRSRKFLDVCPHY